jgi:ABC-type branched-subunit amino acid transport system ATPase component/ABC-type branched-subunit amino acid transport system permease subunit
MIARQGVIARCGPWTAVVLCVVAIVLFPWLGDLLDLHFPTNYELRLAMRAMILGIVVVGLNILVGFTGLVSLGQAALMGLGAHAAALLALRAQLPFGICMVAAVALPALTGTALAFPTVRVRPLYLTVITIAFGFVFVNILREWVSFTGGASGLASLPRPTLLGARLMPARATGFNYYYLIAICLMAALWVQWALARSRYGRAMRATAESENAARILGINVTGIRTLAFAISAGLAGLGGGLFANLALFVNFESFTFGESVELLLMTILGGSGTLAGPVVGTATLFLAGQGLQGLQEWQTFGYGALLALVLFVMPEGIVGGLARLRDRTRARLFARGGVERVTGPWPRFPAGFNPSPAEGEAPGQATLVTRDLSLRFGGLIAVNAVSMVVRSATVHAMIGPNGAGKSSLLNVVSGFYQASSGSVTLFGQELGGCPPHALARLGVARSFQNTELFGRMTVLENVLVGCHSRFRAGFAQTLFRMPGFRREERAAQGEARQLLSIVGLSDFAGEQARNLPFGHQRRLEIARALALHPKLLLLDEPAAGLTHAEILDLITLIRGLAERGLTVILVEHHVEMVMAVSDRVTVLDHGEVIADGAPAAVQADSAVIAAYFGHNGQRGVQHRPGPRAPAPLPAGEA